jgi:hypothetical protein
MKDNKNEKIDHFEKMVPLRNLKSDQTTAIHPGRGI